MPIFDGAANQFRPDWHLTLRTVRFALDAGQLGTQPFRLADKLRSMMSVRTVRAKDSFK